MTEDSDTEKLSGAWLQRSLVVAIALVYAYLMNWSYEHVESYLWEYKGFLWSPPGPRYLLLGYAMTAATALLLPLRLRRPSDVAWTALYGLVLVPVMFLPFHWATNPRDIVPFVVVVVLHFVAMALVLPRRPFEVKPLAGAQRSTIQAILMVGAAATTLYVLRLSGFRLTIALDEDYSRRLAARDLNPSGTLGAYAAAWLEGTFAPLCIALGIEWRRRSMVILGTFSLLVMFSFTGSKQAFILPLTLIGAAYVLRRRQISPALVLLTALAGGIYYGAQQYLDHGLIEASGNFGRRIVMSKGVSSAHYWDMFRDHPVMMRDSSVMSVFGYEKELGKAFVIGAKFGADDENYDANAWAAAFANFGYFGITLVTALITFVFWLLDSFAKRGHFEVMCLMAALFAYFWGEQAFESSLLSSGVAPTLLFLAVLGGTEEPSLAAAPRPEPATQR